MEMISTKAGSDQTRFRQTNGGGNDKRSLLVELTPRGRALSEAAFPGDELIERTLLSMGTGPGLPGFLSNWPCNREGDCR
jgi:hypothetical protein